MLPDDTFTHMIERWHTTSWLDHCVSSGDGHTVIKYMAVLYSTCCSDHIPITVDIAIASIPMLEVPSDEINLSVNSSAADKDTYARDIYVHLNAVKVPVDAICCKDTECSNNQHFEALNVFYEGLVGVLTEASDNTITDGTLGGNNGLVQAPLARRSVNSASQTILSHMGGGDTFCKVLVKLKCSFAKFVLQVEYKKHRLRPANG